MNFSWLSGGDERRMRDPGDGSSLLLTHHREVHRLQSLSMKPNRSYCFNYPALSSIPLSITRDRAMWLAKGGRRKRRHGGLGGGYIKDIISSTFFMPSHFKRGNDVKRTGLDHVIMPLQYNCNLHFVWLLWDFSLNPNLVPIEQQHL